MLIRISKYTTVNLLGAIVLFCAILLSPQKSQADDEEYISKPLDVIFYEIMWAGSNGDEWLVLKNTTDSVIDISGWQITKLSGGNEKLMFELSGQIGANGYYLISHFDKEKSILNIDPDVVSTGVSLVNSNLQLKLYSGDYSLKASTIDIADDGVGSPMAGSNDSPKKSMARAWPLMSGDKKEAWFTNQNQHNLDIGALDYATPKVGVPNAIVENWPEFGTIGEGFNPTITIYHPDDQLLTIYSNGVKVVTGKSMDIIKSKMSCGKHGDQNISIEIVDENNLKYKVENKLFCYQFADLVINEVYPAPQKGEEEWVEIYNPTDSEINLEKWRLVDESGDDFTLTSNHIISPRGYLKIVPDGVSLNNTGDTIELLSPADELVSSAQWGKAKKGTSWAKFDNNYKWTLSPTPSAINILTEERDDEEDDDSDEDESVTTGSDDELSGGGESEGDYAITTKKTSGGDKLLALALNTEQLPKIETAQNFYENSSLPSPLPFENSVAVGITISSIGVLALAKVILSVISLWL